MGDAKGESANPVLGAWSFGWFINLLRWNYK